MRSWIRAGVILAGFGALTLPLMPVQAVLVRVHTDYARRLPQWYHRQVCRLLGLTIRSAGCIDPNQPALIIANHASWLDILLLSALAPVSFVAKKQIAGWPLISTLAKLQRTVFVDRERRTAVGDSANEILDRIASGDRIVLFAEGTSSDGNRVLPFKTSLFAAVLPATRTNRATASGALAASAFASNAVVQTVSIAYTRRRGLPLGWTGRRAFGYYGDVAMGPNAWDILTGGPLEAVVRIGEATELGTFKDRKELSRQAERQIRDALIGILRDNEPRSA